MTTKLRGADIVARSLERLGCKHVFTLSGNHIMSIFDAALETKVDLVHVRHEAAAVHMADAWGRLTGEPGIALVTGGPGHANAVGALFTALGAESPMVLLSGHAATWELGRGGFQELRQADMAAPVTKASWTSTSAARLGRDIGEAMRIAASGRPGPVHVSLPSDLLDERVESNAIAWPDAERCATTLPALAEADADATLAAIARAARPIILAGPQLSSFAGRALLLRLERAIPGALRHPREPARHGRCHARGVPGSRPARRSRGAARQGAGFHRKLGGRASFRSAVAPDRHRPRGGAHRARREGEGRAAAHGPRRRCEGRGRAAHRACCSGEDAGRRMAPRGPRRAR